MGLAGEWLLTTYKSWDDPPSSTLVYQQIVAVEECLYRFDVHYHGLPKKLMRNLASGELIAFDLWNLIWTE